MTRTVTCSMCGKRFTARRKDATTCGGRCRQSARRARLDPGVEPVDLQLQVHAGAPRAQGWLVVPPAADRPPVEDQVVTELPAQAWTVPRTFDLFGRVDEVVACETPEAAAHWDARQWRETR